MKRPYLYSLQTRLIGMVAALLLVPISSSNLNAQSKHTIHSQADCGQYSTKIERSFDKAEKHYLDQQNSECWKILKEILKEDPNHVGAHYLMGLLAILNPNGPQLERAQKSFSSVNDLCPDYHIYTYFYLGEIAYAQEKWSDVVRFMNRFLEDVDKIPNDKDYARARELLKWGRTLNKFYLDTVPFSPEKVLNLSTEKADEYLAIITPDNEWAFFTRKVFFEQCTTINQIQVNDKEYFSMSRLQNDGLFETGEALPLPFNAGQNEGGPSLSVDNRVLFYTVCRKTVGDYNDCDICSASYNQGAWGSIRPLKGPINGNTSWEAQPSLSADGQNLYFASDRPGGQGGLDIWYSKLQKDGSWGTPINMGTRINTPGNEKSPFIHPDGKTLYFASNGHPGVGGYDIFFTRRGDKYWSEPQNIGVPINTPGDDAGLFVSFDGQYGYFSSNKIDTNSDRWNIYKFKLYEAAQPDDVRLIRGYLSDQNGKSLAHAKINIRNLKSQNSSVISVNDNGYYATIINRQDDHLISIQSPGHAFVSKLIQSDSIQTSIKETLNFNIDTATTGHAYTLNDILFESNKAEMAENNKAICDAFVDYLKLNPHLKIEIQGHTDDVGDEQSNLLLSEARAKAVYDYIISLGIPKERLSFRGYGETRFMVPNTNEEARTKNRRTVFLIQ